MSPTLKFLRTAPFTLVLGAVAAVPAAGAPAAPCLSRAQSPVDQVHGVGAQQYFGSSVASFGDLDRDGIEDFAVAIPCDNQSGPLSGSVKIFSGRPATERLNLQGQRAGDLFGSSIARIADLDCDGYDELLVGAPGASPHGRASGKAYVFSGADAHILFYLDGYEAGDEFGASVCSVGDLDGDKTPEFAIGAPGDDLHGRGSGSVRVFDGADAHVVYWFYGDEFGERFGTSLAGPGDMTGDGIPEIAVGAPCPRLDRPGYARVFSGADAQILYTFGGQHTWELFGTSLCATGDVDGDARADLLVGAPSSRSGGSEIEDAVDHACGAATVFSGRRGAPLFSLASDESEDRLGTSLALGPDFDGDGVRDLLVGASQRHRPRAGYVRAFSAKTGAVLETWVGVTQGEQFGSACAVLQSESGPPVLVVGSPADSLRGGSAHGRVTLVELAPLQAR